MSYQIKYENAMIDGIINKVHIKQHIESKYSGYKVIDISIENSNVYVEFELKNVIKRYI